MVVVFVTSCGENRTDKAIEFMQAHMYEQAIALLDQEIQNNPKNAKAHLLMGESKLVTNRFGEAQESFKRATVLEPDIGKQIGEVAIEAAKVALSEQEFKHASQIMSLAQKYDPKMVKISSGLSIEQAQQLLEKEDYDNGMNFLAYALSIDKAINKKASDILLAVLAREISRGKTNPIVDKIISITIELDESTSNKIGKLYFNVGKKILASNEPSLEKVTKSNFMPAIKYDSSLSSPVAIALFSYAKKTQKTKDIIEAAYQAGVIDKKLSFDASEYLLTIAKSTYKNKQIKLFIDAYKNASALDPSIESRKSDRNQILYAIYLYETGNRVESIRRLHSLKNSKDEFARTISSHILSPPTKGVHNVNMQLEWKDLGRPGPMKIILKDYEVTKDGKLKLRFVAINKTEKKNKLLFGYKKEYKLKYFGMHKGSELPYLVDDNGKKLETIDNFSGGIHDKFNDHVRMVLFNPKESIELSISFPMTSEGARSFNFVSPKLNGWQWVWSIKNIPLK